MNNEGGDDNGNGNDNCNDDNDDGDDNDMDNKITLGKMVINTDRKSTRLNSSHRR